MKKQPFHYKVKLPEVKAEVAVEFVPEGDITNVYFVRNNKQHVLTMFGDKTKNFIYCEIDLKTNKLKFYDLVPNGKIGTCEIRD